MSRLALSIFGGLLMALPLGLLSFSPAFASSARRLADQPQDVTRSGVSVVRLIVSYNTGKPTGIVQCTGLGVLVASWPFQSNTTKQNNWILTDGNLVNSGNQATCVASSPTARLSGVEVILSAAYNAETPPLNFTATPGEVRCLKSACNTGPVLFAFNTSMTLPYIDPGTADPTQEVGIRLTKSLSSSVLPITTNTNAQMAGQFMRQAQQYLTPNRQPLNGAKEAGMPIVNARGELTGLHLSDSKTPASLSDITTLMHKQPELKSAVRNPVHDGWDTGITDFYQQNLPGAHTAFQSAAQANPQFQAAQSFAQRTLNSAQGGSENGRTSSQTPGIAIKGISLPLLLSILGLIVLAFLLILTSLKFGRARARKRALKVEYAEAERQATLEAQRIKEMEASQQRTWGQPAMPTQVEQPGLVPVPQGVPLTSPLPDLRCPRCGALVPQSASFCSNCRLQLSPTESGKHLAVAPPSPASAPVASSRSLAEQPTVEMSPGLSANGQTDSDKTVPYAVRQLQGQRLGLAVGTRSDPGIKRKHKPNEDSLFAAQGMLTPDALPQQFGLFVIADGMGGHANGQDASRRAIQTIIDFMLPKIMKHSDWQDEALSQLLAESVQQANQAVHQNNMELRADMGTTVTAALVVGATAYVTNVGDSRTYLYRPSDGLKKVTNDHSVVASLVEAGIIKPDDIYTHPKRNQIYRSLGEKPLVEVDSFIVHLQPEDKLILCSDGLWDMVRDPKIEDVIKSHIPDPDATADALIQAALEGGGEDNVSVIVVSVSESAQHILTPAIQLLAKPESVQMPEW